MRKLLLFLAILVTVPFIYTYSLSSRFTIPVDGASSRDWNDASFWYYPWGQSGTHKGVDIFAKKGELVVASTSGMVLKKGEGGNGGKFMVILGPKMTLHYYAHLDSFFYGFGKRVKSGEAIGLVGNTGNAKGKAPHLHYSFIDILPRFSRKDSSVQGWKKMFFRNPIPYLKGEKEL